MHVPVKIASLNIDKKDDREYLKHSSENRDYHENNSDFQRQVADEYMRLSGERDHWYIINCFDESKNIYLTKMQIHEKIWNIINLHL